MVFVVVSAPRSRLGLDSGDIFKEFSIDSMVGFFDDGAVAEQH